jgi:Major Facilitator Superfamily
LQSKANWKETDAYSAIFWGYALIGLIKFLLSVILSSKCEAERKSTETAPTQTTPTGGDSETQPLLAHSDDEEQTKPMETPPKKSSLLPDISHESISILIKLCLLFAVDSVASGLAPASWLTYFYSTKFHLPTSSLGNLFFVTNILSSASNLVASSLARRIGLVTTMVATHIPASIALALIPLPDNIYIAMGLLIFRSSTQAMDQAPRQAFLAAAVLPAERTAVMGIVNVVKTLSQSVGPVVTGTLAGMGKFWVALVLAGSLKVGYDVGMLAMFLGHRTREEIAEEEEREEEREEQR